MCFNVLVFFYVVFVEESLYYLVSNKEYFGEGLRLNLVILVDEFEKKLREMVNELIDGKKIWKEIYLLFFLLISCLFFYLFMFFVGGVNSL